MQLTEMSREQLIAHVQALEASKQRAVSFKVTERKPDPKTGEMKGTQGAIAMYGLGRFPVTLYRGQWERVIEAAKSGVIERFIEANAAQLSVKA